MKHVDLPIILSIYGNEYKKYAAICWFGYLLYSAVRIVSFFDTRLLLLK